MSAVRRCLYYHCNQFKPTSTIAAALLKRHATGTMDDMSPLIDPANFRRNVVNLLVRVTVVARHISAPELTEFAPIDGATPGDFTRVYGDAYVAGFTEGGEFNALVSVKLYEAVEEDVRAQLTAMFDFSGVGRGMPCAGEIQGETTIAVSYNGGGDISCPWAADWTLESLKEALQTFPERAMRFPMLTG